MDSYLCNVSAQPREAESTVSASPHNYTLLGWSLFTVLLLVVTMVGFICYCKKNPEAASSHPSSTPAGQTAVNGVANPGTRPPPPPPPAYNNYAMDAALEGSDQACAADPATTKQPLPEDPPQYHNIILPPNYGADDTVYFKYNRMDD